jgi:predicted nuclease of predicted toxin-antitoxin system
MKLLVDMNLSSDLVDAQLPPALAKWIADKGHSASAVRDQGLRNSLSGVSVKSYRRGNFLVRHSD